jgi:hypothetical protein
MSRQLSSLIKFSLVGLAGSLVLISARGELAQDFESVPILLGRRPLADWFRGVMHPKHFGHCRTRAFLQMSSASSALQRRIDNGEPLFARLERYAGGAEQRA